MPRRKESATYRTNSHGYERWICGITNNSLSVHQLLAISEGADPRKVFSNSQYDIHHKNGIPWDNRPCNIELLTSKEHANRHIERGDRPHATPTVSKETLEKLHVEKGMDYDEIAEAVGLSKNRVRHWIKEYGLRWDQRWKQD